MVILSANDPPESSDKTSGQERRKLTVGLEKRIPEYEGRDLIKEFQSYLPGLLKRVLDIPRDRVTALIKHTDKNVPALAQKKWSQLLETNAIAAWVDDCCVIGGETKSYIGKDNPNQVGRWLYANFCQYQKESGHKLLTSIVAFLTGNYISLRALTEDKSFAWLRELAVNLTSRCGTSFFKADLTDANFTKATLKNTNFKGAIVTRTCWHQAKKIDWSRLGDSILANAYVRDLLVSGNGYKKSYKGANLKGANLTGANLNEANLRESDISQAILQGANLEGVNLSQANAVGADFTNAHLTGACLEAWNINSTTKLDQVDCRWVYLLEHERLRSNQRGERRPSSGEFAPGEFTKLFEEILNTVDLIFRNGIDWKAFVAAFKKVQVENEGAELAIQSIENKGDGVVVVRVSVPPKVNKEKIHSDFTQNYELALKAIEERYKADIAITMLKGIISGLPGAAALVEACNKLLPAIASLLSLG